MMQENLKKILFSIFFFERTVPCWVPCWTLNLNLKDLLKLFSLFIVFFLSWLQDFIMFARVFMNHFFFLNINIQNNEYKKYGEEQLKTIFFSNNIESYDVLFTNNINFYTLFIIIIVSFLFVLFLLTQANLLNLSLYPNSTFDSEKYSPYECGFSPFRTEWTQFDIKFYLIALLFLVFDVELMFLLPYCLSYFYLGFFSYIVFIIFFVLLILGFLVEWSVGMLTWKGEENSPNLIFFKNKNLLKNYFDIKLNWNQIYIKYIKIYYAHLMGVTFNRKFKKYWNVSQFLIIQKIKIKRPYLHSYTTTDKSFKKFTEKYSRFNFKPTTVFLTKRFMFFGTSVLSDHVIKRILRKKPIQKKIEQFFVETVGEPFIEWFKTATPVQRDFAF